MENKAVEEMEKYGCQKCEKSCPFPEQQRDDQQVKKNSEVSDHVMWTHILLQENPLPASNLYGRP